MIDWDNMNILKRKWSVFFLSLVVLFSSGVYGVRKKALDATLGGTQIFDRVQVLSSDGTTVTTRYTSQIPKLIGVASANVLGEWYAGADSTGYPGDLIDVSNNNRHLADTASPPITNASLVGVDGNQLQAFSYNGSSQYHSLAHAAWMNVFDGDFTFVTLVKGPTAAPVGDLMILCKGSSAADGIYLRIAASAGTASCTLSNSGLSPTSQTIASASSICDGLYHLVAIVRNGLTLTLYVDGAPSAVVVLTNSAYGLDNARTLYIGRYNGASGYFDGHIAYTRLQNSALTFSQIQKEVSLWQGIAPSIGGLRLGSPTFLRSTDSYVSRYTGNIPLYKVPANWPCKSSDNSVLIEGSVTQLLTYTGSFYTSGTSYWTASSCTVAATSIVLPDGSTGTTNTFHEGPAGDGDVTHWRGHALSVTSGTSYCFSLYVKYNPLAGTPREWIRLDVHDSANVKAYYFNVRYGYIGTSSGALTGGSGIRPIGGGWFRIWVWATAGATSASGHARAYISEANGDPQFIGADQDSVFIYGPQAQTGAFPTTYVPSPTTAGSRTADSLTYIPWKISKNLAQYVNATPRLQFLGNESLNSTTVAPTIGAYSFTKNGRPQNGWSSPESDYFQFNGSTDYLSLPHASGGSDFSPAGSFSVVATYTPLSVSGNYCIASKNGGAGNRGWFIYQNNTGVYFSRSTDGTTFIGPSVSSCLETGKPVLITASFSTATGMALRVDAFTPTTEGTLTATWGSSDVFGIGAYGSGAYLLNSKLHYLAYYDGYAISATEHANAYAAFKLDGILPLTMSASTPKKKVILECEAKGLYSSTTNIGASRTIVAISGITGLSSATKSLVQIKAHTDGKFYAELYEDTDATQRFASSAVRTDLDKWHKHKFVLDFANSANSTYALDGVLQTLDASMTGVGNAIDFKDSLIRFGQTTSVTPNGMLEVRNCTIGTE